MLKHFSSALGQVTKNLSGDKKIRLLIAHWPELVGKDYASHSMIDKIIPYRGKNHNHVRQMILRVTASIAPDIDYQTEHIRQRINDFLAENYLSDIRIRQGLPEPDAAQKPAPHHPIAQDAATQDTAQRASLAKSDASRLPPLPDDLSPQLRKSLEKLAENINSAPSS